MKRLLCLLALCNLLSCSIILRPKATFIIENKTSKNLVISTFSKSKPMDKVSIDDGQQWSTEKIYREGGDGDVSPFNYDTDSLVIEFSDGKRITQYCAGRRLYFGSGDPNCDPKKNLMNFYTGVGEVGKRKKSTKTIVLDKSDYNQAVLP